MPSSSTISSTSTPQSVRSARLTLTLGTKALDSAAYARVARVRVDQGLNAATRIEILMRDEGGAFSQSHRLNLGDTLAVGLDWSDGKPSTPLARGVLTGMGTLYGTGDGPAGKATGGTLLRLVGHGPRYRLQHGGLMAALQRVSSGDLMTQLARKKRIQLQAQQARLQLPHKLIANHSVARLLEEEAARAGLVLAEEGERVLVKPLTLSGPAIPLTFGESLYDIRVEASCAGQVSRVKVYGVDLASHRSIVGAATSAQALGLVGAGLSGAAAAERAFGAAVLEVGDCPVRSAAEARALAKALFNERLFRFVTAWGKASGCPELTVGGLVELGGIGKKLSGKYVVTRVTHHYRAGDAGDSQVEQLANPGRELGFQTHFEACRPAIGR